MRLYLYINNGKMKALFSTTLVVDFIVLNEKSLTNSLHIYETWNV